MKTIIVGQKSNLTRYLDKVIQSASIISSQDIFK